MSATKNLLLEQREKDLGEEVFDQIVAYNDLVSQAYDNLFSANHRAAMIRQHGGTQAQTIKIEDLL